MRKANPDKILYIILFLTICVVVFSQIGLVFPKTRKVFTNSDLYEGTLINENETLYGTVCLKLLGTNPSDKLEIFVNGKKQDLFNKKEKEIEITHTSVVEIYAVSLEESGEIEITSMSENVKNTMGTTKIKIDDGFNIIGRFSISD